MSLLEFKDVSKSYGSTIALRNVNLTLEKGKIVGLLGPNGSGKTTMIKLINGLLQPDSGQVLINGEKPGVNSKNAISFLPDSTYLPNWMKVSHAMKYFKDMYANFDKERAYTMLESMKISDRATFGSLSKGNKEKVQLVLVMSRRAEFYILDEPIAGVDPAARDFILDTILSNYLEDATLMISTHLISDIERILEDFIFIRSGEIHTNDSVEHIIETTGKSLDQYFREVFRC